MPGPVIDPNPPVDPNAPDSATPGSSVNSSSSTQIGGSGDQAPPFFNPPSDSGVPELIHGSTSPSFQNLLPDIINADYKTVGWWKFNNTLEDELSSNDFVSDTSEIAEYELFKQYNLLIGDKEQRGGLIFNSGKTYSTEIGSFLLSPNNYSMNMGFWYYSPEALGFVRHAITRQSSPKIAPIISKSNSTVENGFESIVSGQGEWIVSEIASTDSRNSVQISLCNNGNQPAITFVSEDYLPGFHHIYINVKVDQSSNQLYVRIDIDGKCGIQHVRTDGFISMVNTISPLRLNDVGIGYTAHKHVNEGSYISSLLLQVKGSSFMTKTILMMRFGVEMAIISDDEFPGFSFLGIGYDQPTTITTNQIYSEGGSIYAARSNGQLIKGFRPIWDDNFEFTYPDSVQNLSISKVGENPIWTENGLRIKGSTVKI